ncbi:FliM/FliN family flagellar motor C-terminal domain-containing protein [Burkholderia ambifaria]|uniref:FliM/FliN family flagellar motor switch protein n=1 Tax=Burkholderia ambifaria TaxID=152480 RepID=UPI002FE251AE
MVLDPCTLGRPYHLLEDVLQDIKRRIDQSLHERFNLRRGTSFVVTELSVAAMRSRNAAVWRTYACNHGQISVRCDRGLLLTLLACHYGTSQDEAVPTAPAPETGAERRFAAQQHTALLAAFASAMLGDQAEPFLPSGDIPPGPGVRVLRMTISDRLRKVGGDVEFALDDTWLDHLFARLDSQHLRPAPDSAPAHVCIPVMMSVHLLSKNMRLDELLRIRPGDVLPVRLPDTVDVLVNTVRLYRAALAEHQGALWITSFEPVE